MGVVVKRYIDILTIIINFSYSTCISSFFASNIPMSLFTFKMFLGLYNILYNTYSTLIWKYKSIAIRHFHPTVPISRNLFCSICFFLYIIIQSHIFGNCRPMHILTCYCCLTVCTAQAHEASYMVDTLHVYTQQATLHG